MSDEELKEVEEGTDMGVIILMLGLYLIVLAFFILLNAISEDAPDKRDLVVESVQEGFDFRDPGDGVGADLADISFIPVYTAQKLEIEGLLESYLSISDYNVDHLSERLLVTLNANRFFTPGAVKIVPEMILFFEDLAEILNQPKPGLEIQTQIMVQNHQGQDKDESFELAGRRAALFLRALVDENVRTDLISAGALLGTDEIVLQFDIILIDPSAARLEAIRLQENLNATMEGVR